ncbi:small GTPase LIP1-like isoform X1 [Hibiscus syriacus]|uniref:small GTPase LIP1-like isoform X1 n=1 Tax=Hibiscus syriacus TaxID=106335 RepID=UPI001924065B|nr:small GTPase LIP1-like isoform X1 [Hibiscus syriacus]
MFWREREMANNELNGGPLWGQIRVLVVGDSGVGKTSLVHLIVKGSSIARPPQTIGCTVSVKHTTYGSPGSSSSSLKGDAERDFFVELWDVSGHERYKDCRSLFYSQINGVIFVHDLSQRRTKTSLQKWAAEIAASGTFSAPLGSGGPGGLPVPYIVIGNKADIASKGGTRGSSGNLVDAARQWIEKQGLLPSSEQLPLTESFPGSGGFTAATKDARYDKEGVMKFFRTVLLPSLLTLCGFLASICCEVSIVKLASCLLQLIRRRYFLDVLPNPNTWSTSRTSQRLDENYSDDEQFYQRTSLSGDPHRYTMLPPLPAPHNLTPPPMLYPQQPVSVTENYSLPRFSFTGSQDINV